VENGWSMTDYSLLQESFPALFCAAVPVLMLLEG